MTKPRGSSAHAGAPCPPGPAQRIAPGVRLVRAPNPSPMTHTGTNTWIVGTGAVAVIDPGPDDPGHLHAILSALSAGESVQAILVTHAHRDHAPLARALADATGAAVYAAGNMAGRRRAVMADLAATGRVGGGEGVDTGFAPDVVLEDGDHLAGGDWRLDVLATPGHTADHLAFAFGPSVFTGDHVMGWASSLVSPPDGDLVAFMASCARLATHAADVYFPGHGAPVESPAERLAWLVAHRNDRTARIEAQLELGVATPAQLVEAIYTDIAPALRGAAERNVLAHLIALHEAGRVRVDGPLCASATFSKPR